jgi:hypothetical protein
VTDRRPSVIDLANSASSALLVGCGGGGDVIQSIPVVNYLRALGVERFCMAGLGGKWWGDVGLRFGCEVFDLDWLSPARRVGEHAVIVEPTSKLTHGRGVGKPYHEAFLALETGVETATLNLRAGVPGLRQGLADLVAHTRADLVILVDIGSDSFFTGTETTVLSPLLDAMSMDAVNALDVPSVFALTGYGADAEMAIEVLDRNVALAMSHGAYLGAHGLTPQDAADLRRVLAHVPESDIERRPYRVAQGELSGPTPTKRFWSVDMRPIAAVTLFFDLGVLIDHVNPLPNALARTTTLEEAEDAILEFGLFPETRLPQQIEAPTPPQVPGAGPGT